MLSRHADNRPRAPMTGKHYRCTAPLAGQIEDWELEVPGGMSDEPPAMRIGRYYNVTGCNMIFFFTLLFLPSTSSVSFP